MLKNNLNESLLGCAILTHKRMAELLPHDFSDSRLVEAMRYSALSEGKRIRPFLLMASAQIFGVSVLSSIDAAVALEFIHVYSLIHDDLPAMDDDDFRRGHPSNHKKFNEATAILAGDALLTYAFEILAEPKCHKDPAVRCELIKIIAKAAGFVGMAGGQMMDLEKAQQKISKEELAKLHRLKTGELFMVAAESGAVIGRSGLNERKALRYFAHDLGLAFQIRDDILDHVRTTADRTKENTSIVALVGLEAAQKQLDLLREQSIAHLKIFGDKAKLLVDLAEFVVTRDR
ncbi:MAG: polyprenyl synthetase family protein [Alphaproteobacteria bacterium]|nr:polyprenyl synthetase family protein [Alphaproteobacteria bacterium]